MPNLLIEWPERVEDVPIILGQHFRLGLEANDYGYKLGLNQYPTFVTDGAYPSADLLFDEAMYFRWQMVCQYNEARSLFESGLIEGYWDHYITKRMTNCGIEYHMADRSRPGGLMRTSRIGDDLNPSCIQVIRYNSVNEGFKLADKWSNDRFAEAYNWCMTNLSSFWTFSGDRFYFFSEEDRVLFDITHR